MGGGLGGSRHGLGGSRHGKGRSLGFRAKKGGMETMTSSGTATVGKQAKNDGDKSRWASLLTPTILFDNSPTKTEDDAKFLALGESVSPVRRAEIAFKLGECFRKMNVPRKAERWYNRAVRNRYQDPERNRL